MIDIEFLCNKLSDMAGLPVRYYVNKELKSFFCFASLTLDPIKNVEEKILSLENNIDYFITKDGDYYGIINSKETSIIIGPSFPSDMSEQQFRKRAFDLNIPISKQKDFINSLKMLVRMPLNSILQILCTFNYVLNNEKKSINDFYIEPDSQFLIETNPVQSDVYKSYQIEKTLCNIIAEGDEEALHNWVKNAPTVKAGTVASEPLRQSKNTFIVSATVFARCAIDAGLPVEESFKLSDYYIQRCEKSSSIAEVLSLQFKMIQNYTKNVGDLKKRTTDSALQKKICNYILSHISTPITTTMIADNLHLSRSYLSVLFKNETGSSLINYIHHVKIEQAKSLLSDGNKDLTLIADYLGYSSSSHFTRVFKKHTGLSPNRYRKKHNDHQA